MGKYGRTFIKGEYFPYCHCQWCRRDGHCILRHYQFLGVKPRGEIDSSPYSSHEDMVWHLSGFQQNTKRATCNGKIFQTESIYYPLQCECGTAISSLTFSSIFETGFCVKFQPNEKGRERLKIAQEIAKKKGIDLSEINGEELPEPDADYEAATMY